MWLGKFIDLKEDIKSLSPELKNKILVSIEKHRLTPLEFKILESIFNSKEISGYDLIQNLNRQFAGTWEAHSGTIYPILSKLKRSGFLDFKSVKSPIGPLKKVYFLTEVGESVVKLKVNKNFKDQLKFMENFLIELSNIYINSIEPDEDIDTGINNRTNKVKRLLKETFEKVIKSISNTSKKTGNE